MRRRLKEAEIAQSPTLKHSKKTKCITKRYGEGVGWGRKRDITRVRRIQRLNERLEGESASDGYTGNNNLSSDDDGVVVGFRFYVFENCEN